MRRLGRSLRWGGWIAGVFAAAFLAAPAASATEVLLKDGRILKGKLGEAFGLSELTDSADPAARLKQIVFVDDDLRRTFVSKRQLQEIRPDKSGEIEEKFQLHQPPTRGNTKVATPGPLAKQPENFDKFGRRSLTMLTGRGPLTVIQGITEITPEFVKVEGINFIWDMRIATSTIPHDVLHKILLNQIDPANIEQRKKIARFYWQSQRYEDSRAALEDIVKEFPAQTDLKQQLAPMIAQLRRWGRSGCSPN